MKKKISRRSFIHTSLMAGVGTALGTGVFNNIVMAGIPETPLSGQHDIAAITGKDYYAITRVAIDKIGGIQNYISKNSRVAILPNAVRNHPGTNVQPEVLLAIIGLCYEAGAGEVTLIKEPPDGYWERLPKALAKLNVTADIKPANLEYTAVEIKRGIKLKEAMVVRELLDCDHYINVGLIKHHSGTGFTGVIKNIMGATAYDPTNRLCHIPPNSTTQGYYSDIAHLSQCIADLNLIRRPDLCIDDAISYLTTNGPFGPGEIASSDTVCAGNDPVALDAFGTRFLGLKPADVAMLTDAQNHEVGNTSLADKSIFESSIEN